ncbi:hypothetical protein DM02DRAFT_679133 [Periconia macrospinosa]|uniref:DNA-directed DNA polymerase n=1 Tax=Periconia macrospinosa TaxID=97972 RepID=A0A2V1ED49_9PLEO|nr:hypothetical protein DM02DRAFT_679133 [Periconia macrospinosa]
MSSNALEEKKTYFKEQELQSDSEDQFLNEEYLNMGRALAEFQAMPPPRLPRGSGSFLGPTMKEAQREWTAQALRDSSTKRSRNSTLKRSWTESDSNATNDSAISPRKRGKMTQSVDDIHGKSKRTVSMSSLDPTLDKIPSFVRMGAVPRELKNGKNVKLAEKIKLEPEDKQIFRDKIVYMYPNDDISMPRRYRIHKLIQLGAVWVTTWRDDITHILVDDSEHSYSQLLRHFNKAGLPVKFGRLLDPTAGRFLVKGAPRVDVTRNENSLSISTSVLLPISTQNNSSLSPHSPPVKDSASLAHKPTGSSSVSEGSHNSAEDIVKDSFAYEDTMALPNSDNDALSAAIEEARAIAHLPFEEEHDEYSRPPSSSSESHSPGTGDESESVAKRPGASDLASGNASGRGKSKLAQNKFSCMNPAGRNDSSNPNARTIEILDQMCKHYDQMQDQWRTNAYRRAIATLRKQNTKITTSKQAAALPAIGSRLADKIEEIVLTDRLRRLDSTRDDPTDQVLRLFLGIYGVGLSQANKWIQAGYRTLDDLVTKAKLTESQKIGIEHYDDFAQRIPRAEVEAHGDFIKNALRKLDPAFEAIIMGSYRRGAKNSGDIDIIISKPGASITDIRDVVFGTLVPSLKTSGFLKCKLAASSRSDDGTKWHGVSCLPTSTTWRRLDLLLVPDYEMGAALIYFTGNDIFNRSVRLLASKKGMRLNQRGLYKDVVRGKNRERLNDGILVEGRREKKIFEILGVPWREPTERIC